MRRKRFLLVPCSEREKNTGTAIQIVQAGSEHPIVCVCVCEKAAGACAVEGVCS